MHLTLRIAVLLLAASTAAQASSHRPRVPNNRWFSRTKLTVVDKDHATLRVVVTTNADGMQEVSLPVELPEGMTATGLSIQMGSEPAETGALFFRKSARDYYDRTVIEVRDPALLEWTSGQSVRLSVFPVRRRVPATVTIELTSRFEAGFSVDGTSSLVAAPGLHQNDGYADYWPEHRTEAAVASID